MKKVHWNCRKENRRGLGCKTWIFALLMVVILLNACTPVATPPPTAMATPTSIPPTPTSSIRILPTWTPSPTPPLQPSPTARPTSTSRATPATTPPSSGTVSTGYLVDRPTYSTLPKPNNLVSMLYDPSTWSLNTSYPTSFMGYSLVHRSNYDCKLEPTVEKGAEGYQVENYKRPLGGTTYEISRVGQAGVLNYIDYCTGEGEDRTCYQVTPGDDHEACTQAGEAVLATYKLIPNQFLEPLIEAPNHWLCQDESGLSDHCSVSYSVPLNALAYTENGEGWVAGDDGLLYHLANLAWSEFPSPATQPIYDMSFSSPTDGWAVGKGALVIHWDGKSWSEVLPYHGPGEGPGGSTQVLYGVDARAADDAWMVGLMKAPDGKNSPYAIHWDGKDLIEESAFPDCTCGLNAVLNLGHDNVTAVGSSPLGAVSLHWDGSTWTSSTVIGADVLYTLRRAPDGTLWAAGMEIARDQSDTRGSLFRWDGSSWQRMALPALTGGIYQLYVFPGGQIALGGDFSAFWTGSEWQPILASLAGYGWIVDIEADAQGAVWALTRSGNLFKLEVGQ